MKKLLSFAMCIILLFCLSACKTKQPANDSSTTDTVEQSVSLVRVLTATDDVKNIESFEIVHRYGDPTEITNKDDLKFLEKYYYSNVYEGELHELLTFPKNQRINIKVNGYSNTLYLMDDGSIVISEMKGDSEVKETSFEVYKAESGYMLNSKNLIKLLKKYNAYKTDKPASSSQSTNTSSKNNSSKESSSSSKTETSQNIDYGVKIIKKYNYKIHDENAFFKYKTFNDPDSGKTMPYRLYLPENVKKGKNYPVILFLHGAGEIGSDNEQHLPNFTQCFSVAGDLLKDVIIICPQTPGGWNLHDNGFNDQKGYLSMAKKIVDATLKEYSCDRNRIYVTGLSLGSFATWDIIDAYPNYFAAAVPVCGGGGSYASESFINTPIWIYHGTADPTVSYDSSLSTYQAIINSGGKNVKFTTLNGVAHNAWDYAYKDRAMFSWLLAQNRKNKKMVDKYNGILEIIAADGTTVINENNIENLWGSSIGLEECIEVYYDDDADKLLKQKLKKNKDQTFTVKFYGETIYKFKFTKYPADKNVKIIKTVDDKTFTTIITMLENTLSISQQINGF